MRRYYAPFLLRDTVKSAVIAIFTGFLVVSVISIQHIELGLGELALAWVPYNRALIGASPS